MPAEEDDRWDDDDGWDDDDDGDDGDDGDEDVDDDDDDDDDEGWDDAGGDGFGAEDDDGFKDGWNDEGVARALRAVEASISNDDDDDDDDECYPSGSFDADIDRSGTTTTTTTTKQMTLEEDALKASARPRFDSDSEADPDRDAEDELLMVKPSFVVQEEARRASAEAEARKEKEVLGPASVRLETPTTAAEDVELEDALTEDDRETFGAFRQADANRFNPFAKENTGRTGGNASVRDDYEEDDWEEEEETPRRYPPPASRNVSRMAMLPTTSIKTSAPWRARLPHFVPVDELAPQSFHEGEIVHVDYAGQFGGPKSAVAASFARPATAAELGRTSRGAASKKAASTTTHHTRWFTDENGVKTFVDVDGSRKTGKAAYKAAQLAARPKEW